MTVGLAAVVSEPTGRAMADAGFDDTGVEVGCQMLLGVVRPGGHPLLVVPHTPPVRLDTTGVTMMTGAWAGDTVGGANHHPAAMYSVRVPAW